MSLERRNIMEVVLYRLEVLKGKESIAEEWLSFLRDNEEKGIKTLEKENVYFEAYFKEEVGGQMYIYLFIMCKDLKKANNTALESQNELDVKHFEYMKECINIKKGNIMNSELFLDNIKSMKIESV